MTLGEASLSLDLGRRKRITESLGKIDSKLQELYETVLNLLESKNKIPHSSARISIISHCMRELLNSLPEAILGDEALPHSGGSLNRALDKFTHTFTTYNPIELEESGEYLPLRKDIAIILNEIFTAKTAGASRNKRNFALLLSGSSNESHPNIHSWQKIHRFFQSHTHLDRNPSRPRTPPNDEEIWQNIYKAEIHIDILTRDFFANFDELLGRVDSANQMTADGHFPIPTENDVIQTLRIAHNRQLRAHLFHRLTNPQWLPILHKLKVFTHEAMNQQADGLPATSWPELIYLSKVGKNNPQLATRILKDLAFSRHRSYLSCLVDVSLSVPERQTRVLTQIIGSILEENNTAFNPQSMVELNVRLLSRRRTFHDGVEFANLLFRPHETSPNGSGRGLLPDWSLEDGLPQVVELLNNKALDTTIQWLTDYAVLSRKMVLAFQGIRSASPRIGTIELELVNAVIQAANKEILSSPDNTIQKIQQEIADPINHRITLFVLSEALEAQDPRTLNKQLISLAQEVCFSPANADLTILEEWANLIARLHDHQVPYDDAFTNFINQCKEKDKVAATEQSSTRTATAMEKTTKLVTDYVERREQRRLAALGPQLLPKEWGSRLKELNEKRGEIESPLASSLFVTTSWIGSKSPISEQQMEELGAEALLQHLETWAPPSTGDFPRPTHYGQAKQLTTLVARLPAFLPIGAIIEQLRPIYLEEVFEGWKQAVKSGETTDQLGILKVIRQCLDLPLASPFPPQGDSFDDSHDYKAAKFNATKLLQALIRSLEPSTADHKLIAALVKIMRNKAYYQSAKAIYDEQQFSDGWDPLTISLNTQWPQLIQTLIHLIQNVPIEKQSTRKRLLNLTKSEFSKPDSKGAASAILGHEIARLYRIDKDWAEASSPNWFGSGENINFNQQVALNVALSSYSPSPEIYTLLKPAFTAAIKLGTNLAIGWNTGHSSLFYIGIWLLFDALRNNNPENPMVTKFFLKAPVEDRKQVLRYVSQSFKKAEAVSSEEDTAFMQLWDMRFEYVSKNKQEAEELESFANAVSGRPLPAEWWLPKTQMALKLWGAVAQDSNLLIDPLTEALNAYPINVLEIVQLIAQHHPYIYSDGETIQGITDILRITESSSDLEVRSLSNTVVNTLGERGDINIRNRLGLKHNAQTF